jgi:hypothetical protein
MASIEQFLTSKTGAFAAIAAACGLLVLLHGAVRPYVTDRRDNRRNRAQLRISAPDLSELVTWANARDLRFTITNSGGRPAILRELRLRVDSCEPSPTTRSTSTAAPITVYEHRVELAPGKDLIDIRKRNFGTQLPPLNFDKGESAAFVVKLVSTSPHVYRLRVEALWSDSGDLDSERLAHTEYLTADYPKNAIRD